MSIKGSLRKPKLRDEFLTNDDDVMDKARWRHIFEVVNCFVTQTVQTLPVPPFIC